MTDQVDEVKSKIDIVSVIGEHITLKKAGRNFKGLCPFHAEKTPSFMVSQELQIFKCFGCGEAGDVIAFLQKYEGMEFIEALKFLADRAGVELKSFRPEETSEREKIFEVNKFASRFYHYVLLNHETGRKALAYLTQKRGLKIDTIKKFELGYSPFAPGAMTGALIGKKKFTQADLERAGLVYYGGGKIVDRFAGRVIFPLFDHRGNVIAFAGRVLPDDKRTDVGKYINSPETAAYSKSKVLYGLNLVKQDIKNEKCAIIVEGELDMIASWQAGVKNVVAIKGSALTDEQVRLLTRFTDEVILALDTDFAGDVAARRGITVAQAAGLSVRVAVLKGYKDPDEMARGNPEGYKEALKQAVGVWDYIIDSVVARYDLKTGEGKAKISRELTPILAAIEDKIVQAHYIEKVAEKLGVPREAVAEQISSQGTQSPVASPTTAAPQEKSHRERVEEELLALAFQTDPSFLLKKEILGLFAGPISIKILAAYKRWQTTHPEAKFDATSFSQDLPAELLDSFAAVLLADNQIEDDPDRAKKELLGLVQELSRLGLKERLSEIRQKMVEAEREGKEELSAKLQKEFADLSRKLSEVEQSQVSGIIG